MKGLELDWAERVDQLESKDARNVWHEIAQELNSKCGTNRPVDKYTAKIKI